MGERTDVWFGVLGPLEVVVDGRAVAVPFGQLRALLASLLLPAGRAVSVDDLAERLWPDRLPVRARSTLHTYVARLRRLLGRDLIQTAPGGGYFICAAMEQVDLWRFREVLSRAAKEESAEAELAMLRQALRLWRGRPFADVNSDWLGREVVPPLTEEWSAAVERRLDLEAKTARSGSVIAELRGLIADNPTRESLWLRLIDELRRSGRRVDALDAYRQVRTVLIDEFGIEPGAALQELHREVLSEAASVDVAPTHSATPQLVRQLPHDLASFCGRAEFGRLDRIMLAIEADERHLTTIVAIDGAPGTGKTTLAVHWAHQVALGYPDLQLYVNLRGYGPGKPMSPSQAVETLLRGVGVHNEAIPARIDERAALLRSVLAGRRTLLLLDDARDADQVRALLPGGDSLVVITSRSQLRDLAIRDGAHRVTLGPMSMDEALAMLAAVLGSDRVAAEASSARRLVELCDGLPLALAIVAERASRAGSLHDVVRALLEQKARLDAFDGGATDPHTDLGAALSWSY